MKKLINVMLLDLATSFHTNDSQIKSLHPLIINTDSNNDGNTEH